MLCQIGITYKNFKTFEKYLRELKRADRQVDRQTNRVHKKFSTLLECVKIKEEKAVYNHVCNISGYLKRYVDKVPTNYIGYHQNECFHIQHEV